MCSKKKGVKVAKIVALVGLGVLGVGGKMQSVADATNTPLGL